MCRDSMHIRIMQYEILKHTGDAKIKAFGKTKEELFLNAMLGMNAILKSRIENQEARIKNITVKSSDLNMLLVDFLNEVNYLRLVDMELYDKIKFTKFSDTELEGELEGCEVEEFGEDIKAVTFHEMGIRKNEEGAWETCIVFDI